MTTKQLGNIGEAKALAKFVELQIPVYIPFGDNEKSDLIADFNGKLNKVQVKTSEEWIDSEKFVISLVSPEIRNDSKRKFHSCVLQGLLQQPLFSNRLLIYGAL